MKFLFLSIIFFTQLTVATNDQALEACEIKKVKQMEIDTIASNLANFNTTRTPEGGPYKRKKLVCQGLHCEMQSFPNAIIKHMPGHPDADSEGYVRFPDMNLQEEITAMNLAQRTLESVSKQCKNEMQ